MRLKILYIGGHTAAERGAVGTHTAGVLQAMEMCSAIELRSVFFSFALPSHVPARSTLFPSNPPRTAWTKALTSFRYFIFARSLVQSAHFDYVYLRFDPFAALAAAWFLPRCRLIVEYNDVFLDQIEFAAARNHWGPMSTWIRRSGPYRWLVHLSERVAFAPPNKVVAVTNKLLEYCTRIHPRTDGLVLLNATNAVLSDSRSKTVGQDDALVLGHVGTLTYWDGLEELLAAIAYCKNAHPSKRIMLAVVGHGSLEQRLRQRVEELELHDRVFFEGPVDHATALERLLSVDVVPLLKTIAQYGLSPIKLYEAIGLGRTVLASDIPHLSELPTWIAKVVPFPLRVPDIADALIALHDERHEIRQRREEISSYARAHHSWSARIDSLVGNLLTANHALTERTA